MSSNRDLQLEQETQQQEVDGGRHLFELDRRNFLKLFGGGILICASAGRQIAQESGRMRGSHELPKDVAAWLHIAEDGHTTVFTGKVEVGQNIRTSLAQQVAEELKKYFGEKLCTTTIPRNIRLAEAPSHGLPALVYDVRSRGAESYIRLAKEILGRQLPAISSQPPVSAEMDRTA